MKKRSGKLMSVFGMIAVLAISLAGCDLFGQKRVEVSKPEIVVDGVNVSITCETEGAEIMYKIDSGDVKKYEGVFTLTQNRAETEYTIEAYAVKDGVESETSKKKAVIPGSAKTFIVTFVNGEEKTEVKVLEDDAVEAVTVTKEGYTFKCWLNGDEEYDLEAGVTSDLTLTACWSAVEYKITYDVGEGTNAEANPAVYTIESEDITLAAATGPASKPNFVAWHTTAAPAEGAWGDKVTGVAIKKGSTGDKTFYAEFSDKTVYTVSFYDGDTLLKEESVEEGKAAEASQEKKEGYSFGGWFADAALTTAADLSSVTANVKVYAKYTIITYSVTFYSADGTEIPSQTVNHGAKASAPTTSLGSRTGFTANGKWYADGKEFDFDTAITANTSLAAGWKYDTDVVIQTGDTTPIVVSADGSKVVVETNLPDTYLAKKGDVLNLKLNAVSNVDISNLKVNIECNAQDTVTETQDQWGWIELSEPVVLVESASAKTDFEASVQIVIKADANGTGEKTHKVTLTKPETETVTKLYSAGTDVDNVYQSQNYEYTIKNKTLQIPVNQTYGYQIMLDNVIPADVSLKTTDTVTITIEGCFDVDVKDLQIFIVDNSTEWNVLSSQVYIDSFDAHEDFEVTKDIVISSNQIGAGAGAHKVVLCSNFIKDGETIISESPTLYPKGHEFNESNIETVSLVKVAPWNILTTKEVLTAYSEHENAVVKFSMVGKEDAAYSCPFLYAGTDKSNVYSSAYSNPIDTCKVSNLSENVLTFVEYPLADILNGIGDNEYITYDAWGKCDYVCGVELSYENAAGKLESVSLVQIAPWAVLATKTDLERYSDYENAIIKFALLGNENVSYECPFLYAGNDKTNMYTSAKDNQLSECKISSLIENGVTTIQYALSDVLDGMGTNDYLTYDCWGKCSYVSVVEISYSSEN